MFHRCNPLITSAVAARLVVGVSTAVMAQTTGSTVIAPGADTAGVNVGGIGPGNVPIAPGAAGRGEIERIGPGGIPLAPGAAGRVSGGAPMSTPGEPASGGRRR